MNGFTGDRWSGDNQLFWTGAKPGDRLDLELPVEKEGEYDVIANLTMAPNYAQVQLSLDDEPIGEPIDLYEGDVVTTGELTLATRKLTAGPHKLSIEIKGANPAARKGYLVGVGLSAARSEVGVSASISASDRARIRQSRPIVEFSIERRTQVKCATPFRVDDPLFIEHVPGASLALTPGYALRLLWESGIATASCFDPTDLTSTSSGPASGS